MRILILLYCVWLTNAGITSRKNNVVTINGKHYDKELLFNIGQADRLSLDKSTNTLFFRYKYPKHMDHDYNDGIAYYNIDAIEFKDLLDGGRTTAVDHDTGDVYLGGVDGIYKYNSLTKTVAPYAAKGVNIYYVYVYRTMLYYTTYPHFEIYRYDGKKTEKVSNTKVMKFIGDEEKFYFGNVTGLYRVLDDIEENAELFSDSINGFSGFTQDNNNKIFVVKYGGLYTPNDEEKKLDKIGDIEHIRDIVFDKNNNIIYSDFKYSIYRLTPSEAKSPLISLS